MSYVIDQPTPTPSRRRRWPWALVAVLLLALVAAGAFVIGRQDAGPAQQASPQPAPHPAAPESPWGALTWTQVAGSPVPHSASHGPREEVGGVARGYSHDDAGAVLAAINIGTRASSAAGAGTYQAVLQTQTYGDLDLALQQLSAQSSSSSPEQTQPRQWWYAIKAGNPRGDLVEVSLIARTAQADGMGGYVRLDRTLAWRDGDWKMQVPPQPPSLVTTTAGYTPIGGPGQ